MKQTLLILLLLASTVLASAQNPDKPGFLTITLGSTRQYVAAVLQDNEFSVPDCRNMKNGLEDCWTENRDETQSLTIEFSPPNYTRVIGLWSFTAEENFPSLKATFTEHLGEPSVTKQGDLRWVIGDSVVELGVRIHQTVTSVTPAPKVHHNRR